MQRGTGPGTAMRTTLRAVLLALAPFVVDVHAQVGNVYALSGNAVGHTASGDRLQVRVGSTFETGTTFITSGDDAMDLMLADGQHVTLAPNTTVRVERRASGLTVSVITGSIHFYADVREASARARVESVQFVMDGATVIFTGTTTVELTIAVDGPGSQAGVLMVERGQARIATASRVNTPVSGGEVVRWQPSAPLRFVPGSALPAILQARLAAAQAAAVELLLANLPATAAGTQQSISPPPPGPASGIASPGGGGGCVGSGC
jgi:hypothetical protein